MAQRRARPTQASEVIRSVATTLRLRRDALARDHSGRHEWRRLQVDAVQALIEAQRTFLDLHTRIVGLLGRDKPLYSRLRLESIEVMQTTDQLRVLIREIERVLVEH